MLHRLGAAVIAFLAVIPVVAAQPQRYDLGRKYVAFEVAWDEHSDAAARKRALAPLKQVMPAFFSGRVGVVAQLLDEARHALEADKPAPDAVRWADSIVLIPKCRLIDPQTGGVTISAQCMYDARVPLPPRAQLRLHLLDADRKSLLNQSADILALPIESKIPLGSNCEGDCHVRGEIMVDGRVLARHECGISIVPILAERMANYKGMPHPRLGRPSTEQLTASAHYRVLKALAGGRGLETDYPAARLLNEMLALDRLEGNAVYFDHQRPGQFWLTLATEKGPAPIRLQVPKGLDAKPRPLVIAMHGAGGTENMFFDGYGHGEVVRQCEQRKWLVAATRSEGFLSPPPAGAIVDELAKRYPIDRKNVFVIGHSMGASHVTMLAQSEPDRWRGLVCLGGSGGLKHPEKVNGIPFYVGVGSDDFALAGARSLATALRSAGSIVKLVEYPDVEHIAVVQVALPEVFRWLDELAAQEDPRFTNQEPMNHPDAKTKGQ